MRVNLVILNAWMYESSKLLITLQPVVVRSKSSNSTCGFFVTKWKITPTIKKIINSSISHSHSLFEQIFSCSHELLLASQKRAVLTRWTWALKVHECDVLGFDRLLTVTQTSQNIAPKPRKVLGIMTPLSLKKFNLIWSLSLHFANDLYANPGFPRSYIR